ncbi:MAG TPA: AmmeMemoRadiSam system protein A [Terriglobales bacterium]|jgi:AmmeMemoRadiSam system protein A
MSPSQSSRKNELSRSEFSPGEFTEDERRFLLHLAHQSIDHALDGRSFTPNVPGDHLAEQRGAFCTLYVNQQLRGCVGYIFPVTPLFQTVAETARAAAFDDPRFSALTRPEALGLKISLSILSPLFPVEPEQVEVGVHGLLVNFLGRRGLLLPQVPTEHNWERQTFIEQTCIKAGLPSDACKRGAKLEAFTAEIFGEE